MEIQTQLTLGSWLCFFFFFVYGTIYSFSVANWHETVHKTAFKTRWLNEFFYHISSFMSDFEGFRWRWSHTFHHSKTLQTKDIYDHEIQVSRPTDLIAFFLNFIPFTAGYFSFNCSRVKACLWFFLSSYRNNST